MCDRLASLRSKRSKARSRNRVECISGSIDGESSDADLSFHLAPGSVRLCSVLNVKQSIVNPRERLASVLIVAAGSKDHMPVEWRQNRITKQTNNIYSVHNKTQYGSGCVSFSHSFPFPLFLCTLNWICKMCNETWPFVLCWWNHKRRCVYL